MEQYRHARDRSRATTNMDDTEEGSDHQREPRPHLAGEEVGGHEHVHMDTDELLLGHGGLALRDRGDAVTLEDIAHRLVADAIAQVGHGANDAVIAPGAILAGHPHHQGLQLLGNAGTSESLARLRTAIRLGHERAVLAEDDVRLCNRRDLFQCLPTKLLADLGQGLPLSIGQLHPSCLDLVPQDAVFRRQIRVAPSEFLIDGSRHMPQQLLPIHGSFHPQSLPLVGGEYGPSCDGMQDDDQAMVGP
jgi:hypothetical protein